MPARPDLREIAHNVRDAFSELDKDALLDILTFVVKEYVVEGPPPMLVHQAETLADLRSASFAQLISAMQTRFDFPELAMFVVDGERVSVRINGVVQPLIGQRQPVEAPPPRQMVDTRPRPAVRVVETVAPPAPTPPAAPAPASAATSPPDKPEGSSDDAAARFSLLELD